jgi:hypothetical protein
MPWPRVTVPRTSARRGKRIKVRFGCRHCRRDFRVRYLAMKYGTTGRKVRRWYCD